MKVLLVSPLPPPAGGIATWTVKYRDYCAIHNIPLVIVNNAVYGSRAKQINTKRNVLDEVRRTSRVLSEMCCKMRKEKPDVIHLNSSCSRYGIYRDCICAIIGRVCAVPVVLQCHCNIQDQVHGRFAAFAFKVMAALSQRVLVLNRFSADYVCKIAGSKVKVVPNFIDVKDIVGQRKIADTVKQVIFVGHVQREKGVIEIIQAAKRFPDVQFTLVGPVHQEIEKIERSGNVVLLGNQTHEQVIQLLNEADVFLFPSYTEGFANALLEAMTAGLPVIATDVGANAEMIENDGGIIIPVGDSNALVSAIAELNEDPDRRLCMSNWNTKKVCDTYLLDTIMKRFMDVYIEVVM